jgi:Mn-dependent DtxR family transcriptional regulator
VNPTLSQKSWQWIKERKGFQSHELANAMNVSLRKAQNAIEHLKKVGAIETSHRAFKGTLYVPIENAAPFLPGKNTISPQPKSIRQRMWNAMRYLTKFTIADIQAASDCSKSSVEKYLSDLRKYGYVATVKKQNVKSPMSLRTGNFNRYLLINNTGHKYPVMGVKGMRDQNLNKLMPEIEQRKVK